MTNEEKNLLLVAKEGDFIKSQTICGKVMSVSENSIYIKNSIATYCIYLKRGN